MAAKRYTPSRQLILLMGCFAVVCAQFAVTATLAAPRGGHNPLRNPRTTYERFLPKAIAGDPEVQNVLGYMFFYGEGVERDFQVAHEWFHLAAEQNNKKAQQNLALFHAGAVPEIPSSYEDVQEANHWFSLANGVSQQESDIKTPQPDGAAGARMTASDLDVGGMVFVTYCAGCHGADGVAAYPSAPSFAKGERMHKSDAELMTSLMNGVGIMPSWRDTVPEEVLKFTLSYLRSLAGRDDAEGSVASVQDETSPPSAVVRDGGKLYATFCAGCHGFNGIAYYVYSPSFALGERMHKSDSELLHSIAAGRGMMPGWDNMLSEDDRRMILAFLRQLQQEYEMGIAATIRGAPSLFFRFRPTGESGKQ